MVGAFDTVKQLDASAARLIDKSKLSNLALQPLPAMNLIELDKPLVEEGTPCLRDRFHARMAYQGDTLTRIAS